MELVFTGDTKSLERSFARVDSSTKKAEASAKRFGGALHALKIGAIATGAAVGVGLAAAIATGTREVLEMEKAMAQTEARIKSTKGAANVTAKEVGALAQEYQALSGAQDEQVVAAENVLLSMTNIRQEAGKGNDIFRRATLETLNLSIARNKDLAAAALIVGKALNDPIKGLTALGRVGVQFNEDQKKQIKTLIEHGRTLDAQRIILTKLHTAVGGSAVAFGNTTAGQIERIKRAWEDVSEALVIGFLPVFTRLAKSALRHMPEIEGAFRSVGKTAEKVLTLISRGDWGGLGKMIGKALIEGIGAGIQAGMRSLEHKLRSSKFGNFVADILLGSGVSPSFKNVFDFNDPTRGTPTTAFPYGGRNPVTGITPREPAGSRSGSPIGRFGQSGGFIPGRFDARDDVPVNLSRGEVVLNPGQQRMVGIDRIMGAFRATGAGPIGGGSFASGGIVGGAADAAYQRATSKLGTAYNYGVWDCSKFATYVAGVDVGGSTATAYPMSSPARGSEAVLWGFRKSHSGGYRGGPDEHMGVRVKGRWFDNGSGGVQSDADSARWEEVRVPRGWEGSAITDTATATAGRGRPQTALQKLTRALRGLGVGGPAGAAAATLRAGAGDPASSGHLGVSDADERAIRKAGRAAGSAGGDEARTKAENAARLSILRRNAGRVTDKMQALVATRNRLESERMQIVKSKHGSGAQRAAAIAAKNAAIRRVNADLRALKALRAGINDEIAELGYVPAETSDATDGGGDSGGPDTGADQSAIADQATQAAAVANARAKADEAFFRATTGQQFPGFGGTGGVVNNYIVNAGLYLRESDMARQIVATVGGQSSVLSSLVPSPL
jgi:hypothetical protein